MRQGAKNDEENTEHQMWYEYLQRMNVNRLITRACNSRVLSNDGRGTLTVIGIL